MNLGHLLPHSLRRRYLTAALACAAVALGLSASLVLTSAPAPAWADAEADTLNATAEPDSSADYYAVLHKDGSLVFQARPSEERGATNFAASRAPYAEGKAPWLAKAAKIVTVRFDESFAGIRPESLAFWFADCKNLRAIDLENLDASASESMRSMFSGCSSLATIEHLSSLDTSSSTYFGSMFRNCSSLTALDLSHFDATHVGVLCFMFAGCTDLETLNMTGPGWKTSSLYLMVHVWEDCSSLKSLDLSSLDTSGVRSMARDFNGCSSLEYLNLSGIDTTGVGSLEGLFDGCDKLAKVKLGDRFTFNGSSSAPQCSLPAGTWRSAATGAEYSSADVPNNTADTYTRATEGGSVEELDGDAGRSESDGADAGSGAASSEGSSDAGNATSSSDNADDSSANAASSSDSEGSASDPSSRISTIMVNAKKVSARTIAGALAAAGNDARHITTVTLGKRVEAISKGTFKNTRVSTIVVKTRKLSKASVKGSLKGSQISVVKVKAGKEKASEAVAAKYKKIFTKKNAGRKVRVVY